jgi:uncharacterized membrane protein required for colicin V production
MNDYIVDLILAVIFVFITVAYYKRGFVKTILNFASFFIAIILAKTLSGKVTDWMFSNTKLFAGMERYIAKLIVFVLGFIILSILLKWIISLINKVFKLPVLKQANKILGGVLGACCGAIAIIVLCVCLQISSHVVYNSKYVNAVDSSKIVQIVLSDEKIASNIEAFK